MTKPNYQAMQSNLWARIMRLRMAPSETQMLAVIVRETWEKRRQSVELSVEDFKRATNNAHTITVERGISGLVEKGLITVKQPKDYGYVKRYQIVCITDELAA